MEDVTMDEVVVKEEFKDETDENEETDSDEMK